MTIKFVLPITPQRPMERFVVEFERDGSISFPGYDLEYDQTIAALSGEETTALKIYDLWSLGNPEAYATVIEKYLALKSQTIWRFAVDCAAHVIDIYEDEFKNDTSLRDVVNLVIRSIPHHQHNHPYNKFISNAYIMAENITEKIQKIAYELGMKEENRLTATFAAGNTVRYITYGVRCLTVVMISAPRSRGYKASFHVGHDWEVASKQELDWELRRFHDVILAKQHGKKWPSLEATE